MSVVTPWLFMFLLLVFVYHDPPIRSGVISAVVALIFSSGFETSKVWLRWRGTYAPTDVTTIPPEVSRRIEVIANVERNKVVSDDLAWPIGFEIAKTSMRIAVPSEVYKQTRHHARRMLQKAGISSDRPREDRMVRALLIPGSVITSLTVGRQIQELAHTYRVDADVVSARVSDAKVLPQIDEMPNSNIMK